MRGATDNALLDVKLNGNVINFAKTTMILPGNATATGVIGNGTGFASGLGPDLEHSGAGSERLSNRVEILSNSTFETRQRTVLILGILRE